MATRPSTNQARPSGAVARSTSSMSAMPCSTPKLIQLRGNMNHEPRDTSTAHAATWAQRFQNLGHDCPRATATAWPAPAASRNRLTISVRCVVHSGSA